ncbi:polyadenylate-binding protein 1-like isoform X2 [Silurus meridionalis]|nr:polyadenylate-binding protein 1-like isoform X2 [Silurus meridionalis]XP_046724251.1 polyadenylate-binding protein 1-like isoform X2 [Silurus meridionalis]
MNFKLATLYVGDLHPEVTEAMLVGKFSPSGHLHSVRVCKKWETGASLGYAYVNFYQQSDAERALETLNCVSIMGKPMRVMWCQRDSTIRKSGVGNLFIRNLDVETDDSTALFDLFSCFGKVLSCKVVPYKTGTKGYGYVQFESQEAANLAKERLNGKLFNNHIISVEHFKSRKERDAAVNCQNEQKEILDLYIKNLDEHINNEYLYREFSKFGTVIDAKVIMENGRSRGFGFVQFLSAKEAAEARRQLNGTIWGRKPIYVGVAQHKEERQRVKPAPPQVPAVEQSPSPPLVPDVEQNPAPPQVLAVKQSLAPPQFSVVKQNPAPPQVPAGKQSPAPPQVPAGKQSPAPPQVPAGIQSPAPPQVPAGIQSPAPPQVPAGKESPAPPQVPAGIQSPAPPQVPAGIQSAAPPQVPAAKQSPAPPQVLVVEKSPAPLEDNSVNEKTAPLGAKDLVEVPIISEVSTTASPQPHFTIYMLESNSNFEEQFQMAHDHLLPLVQKIHPSDPNKSTWMLVKSEKN